ncbi:nuclear envelope-associated protein 2-like [Wolffia australiana]
MSSAPEASSSSSPQLDPLLKDLTEKKQSFRKSVVSLAQELKDVRNRLSTQEQSVARETQSRKLAERRAKSMEEEMIQLQKRLKEKEGLLEATTASAEQSLKDMEKLKDELSSALAAAEASAALSESAETRCLILRRELEEKDLSLIEHEERVNKMGEQLILLQKDLEERERSQHLLKGEVLRIEKVMMEAMAEAGSSKELDLRRILEEISPKNVEILNKNLLSKDEEIRRLRDEIRFISAHWKHKTKELEGQLERQRRADQELKKRVVKLEFCLHEMRVQTRRLQRISDKREKEQRELKEQISLKERNLGAGQEKPANLWESSGFKMFISMSMLVLVVFARGPNGCTEHAEVSLGLHFLG